jgi:hypothetical protein
MFTSSRNFKIFLDYVIHLKTIICLIPKCYNFLPSNFEARSDLSQLVNSLHIFKYMIWILSYRNCSKIGQKTYRMVFKTKRREKDKKIIYISFPVAFHPFVPRTRLNYFKGLSHAKRRLFEDKKKALRDYLTFLMICDY